MATEIERKFLVTSDDWRKAAEGTRSIRQGYIALGPPTAVRVRIADGVADLNVKKATLDIRRLEYEVPLDLADAEEMLSSLCVGTIIEKTRHLVRVEGTLWEVDEFHGVNDGLVVAEVELGAEDETFASPPWLGEEVSGDPRYLNTTLTMRPFSQWKERNA